MRETSISTYSIKGDEKGERYRMKKDGTAEKEKSKEQGKGENGRIKENKELASFLMLVKTVKPYSRKSSVGPLSHAGRGTGARLCFFTSTFQTSKTL